MIRADPSGQRMSGSGPIEHAADRRAVDVLATDAKADNAPGKHIHDDQYPVAVQQYRLATKQINAPKGYPWLVR